jgi:hypothetical protein
MTSGSLNIDQHQSNILQMWGSQTNTPRHLRAGSYVPSGISDSYPPSEAGYGFKGLPENTSSMIELNPVVMEKSDEFDESYDIESAAANSGSRPSKILPLIFV